MPYANLGGPGLLFFSSFLLLSTMWTPGETFYADL